MKELLISIILPVYNSNSERLSQSLESVLLQSYKNFELIIIDDASTTDIETTILQYKQQDPRIVYIKNNKNLKLTKTLNKGISISKGKYIARIDDDDIWIDTDKLTKQIDFMESNLDYGLCGTNIALENTESNQKINIYMQEKDTEIRNRMLLSTQFSHSSIMIRKESIDKCGTYNADFNLMEDHELWLRIGKKYKLYNIQDFTTLYRINPQGVSLQNRNKQQKLALQLCWLYRNDYPHFLKGFIGNIILNIFPESVIGLINKLNRLSKKPLM